MNDSCVPHGAFGLNWTAKGIGFGQMYFRVDTKDGYVHCSNEYMGREFLKRMLCAMVDNCVLDDCRDDGLPPDYNPIPVNQQ